MMEILHTTVYDTEMRESIAHLNNYPQMFPFIGRNWQESKYKTLLLGESHYIDEELFNEHPNFLNDWYNNSSKVLNEYYTNYINTRYVIDIAEKVSEFGFRKPLTIFYNVKSVIKDEIPSLSDSPYIFPFFSFYNYFQRPAIIEGDSINNTNIDNEIAYTMLKEIIRIIQPEKIVFISKKAFNAFNYEKDMRNENAIFEKLLIETVPHPSCAWWNRKSKTYSDKTGKEKFIEIIKELV